MKNTDYWRTLIDRQRGEKLVLYDEDFKIIKRLSAIKCEEFDILTFFTHNEMKMTLSERTDYKRNFVPSKREELQVCKYVHAIKMGLIKPRLNRYESFNPAPEYLFDDKKN